MSTVTWTMRLYDLDGNALTAASYDTSLSASNFIRHAFDRTLTFTLNGIDELSFQLYLDDPMVAKIQRGKCVVKVYRDINDTEHSKTYNDPTANPSFAGICAYTIKNGEANTMLVRCFSPLWRLQFHFHLLNHYLETNPDTSDFYTQSELMWKLIQLVNDAFGSFSYTGIDKGSFLWGLPGEPQVAPYFVGKGTNTWSNIFDDLMNRPSSPDIIPVYAHSSADPIIMFFTTDQKRGSDVSSTFSFNYHTGTNDNCDDMSEEDQILPGEFGNYLWVVGSGGPNTGRYAARANSSSGAGTDGFHELGVYMLRVDREEVKRVDALSPIADAEFDKRKHPTKSYTINVSPVSGDYFAIDYNIGDVVYLNSDRTGMEITNVKQRIYQATLTMSENNLENVDVLIAKDFYGKVET